MKYGTYRGHDVRVVHEGACDWSKCTLGDDCTEYLFLDEKLNHSSTYNTHADNILNRTEVDA